MIPLTGVNVLKRCRRTILATVTRLGFAGRGKCHIDLGGRHLKGVFAAAEVGQRNGLAV